MSVYFKKFNQIQYENFKELSIHNYAEDFIKSCNYNEEDSLQRANEDFNNILTQGLDTAGNYLCSILSEEEIEVGYIWYNINNAAAYLCDFYIYNDFRRKGYATHALANLELEVKQFGCNEIALNVFDYNTEAITLYEKCGYHLCSIVEAGCRYLIKQLN